jgi:type II secretory pathway pseudopilin PulG
MASGPAPGRRRASGFSLVELLVALVFTGVLMAGMARVFRSSVSAVVTFGEGISGQRRNRLALDQLTDDLNHAGLFLSDLSAPPMLSATNPAFYILPNMTIADGADDDPAKADQLLFYLDEPLPFEGTLSSSGTNASANTANARSGAELVLAGAEPTASDSTYSVTCREASYANIVKQGHAVVFKDAWEALYIVSPPTVSGTKLTIQVGANPQAALTGQGAAGGLSRIKHMPGSDVMFFRPAQMVRYSIKMKLLDPQRAKGVPCLIRDQGPYAPGGFAADTTQEAIVAENITGFKAYLSADSGETWVGLGKDYSDFGAGWSQGLQADLNSQLTTYGRADFQTTVGRDTWIRSIPVLVRLDITSRTALKRSEYANTAQPSLAFKEFTQSLVLVPRHFGLTLN